MHLLVRLRHTFSHYLLAAALVLLAVLFCTSRSESAEAKVTTNRLEHLDRFDPDTPREFDIPRLPQPLAIKALAQALYGSADAERESNDEGDLVGPVQGVMSTRKAWSLVAKGCSNVSVMKVEVTKSYGDFATDDGWYDYLNTIPASAAVKRNWSLPKLNRLDAVRAIAETYGVHINYMARTVEEEQEMVEPFFFMNADLDTAVRRITQGTMLESQWLYDINTREPMFSIEPASYRFSAHCPRPVVVVAKRLYEFDFGLPLTITRREIELSGAKTIPELLTRLSENGTNRAVGSNAPGAQYVDLRGLGPEMFLVLINGRRVMPSASDLNTSAFDIASIPLPAVERIEIQVDSASTRHGSDAIAGVLNIVTNRKLSGPHAEVSYGGASGGAIERRATLGWGVAEKKTWDLSAVLDTFTSSGLLGGEREIWADQNYAAQYGGTDYRSQFVARSASGEALPALSSSVAYLPSTPEPVSLFKYRSLVPEAERASFVGAAEYKGTRFTGNAELLLIQRKNSYAYFPPTAFGVVPADSPNNPYHVPLIVNSLLTGRPAMEQHVDSELKRAVLGVRGRAANWVFDVSGMISREDAQAYVEGQLDSVGVAKALAASEPSSSLDVFSERPGERVPADVLAERQVDRLASDGDQLLVTAEGALFRWRAGSARLNLGHEYRREAVQLENDGGKATRYVHSSYGEATIPLIDASMKVPGVRVLNARAGIRYDSYRGASSVAKTQFSLEWDSLDRLSFGVTHAEAYRPPSLYELRMPVVSFPTVVFDSRQNRVVPITFISGGNADLKPSDGTSNTAYVTYEPRHGLRLQARYFSVEVANHIALLPIETALQCEMLLPDRVERAEPTPEERAAGLPGRLLSVDSRRTNYGRLSTSGIDVAVLQQFATRFGYWTTKLSATWIDSYRFSALPIGGSPTVDRVGMADVRGSITRWRSVGSLGWSNGPWDLTTDIKFVPSYRDTVQQHEIGSQTIWNAGFSYALNDTIALTFAVRDILDTSPHFAFVGAATGWDWTQWDPVGRRWSLEMKISL